MCGRYTVYTESEIIEMNEIIAEVGRRFGPVAVRELKTGEIFPTTTVPMLISANGKLEPCPGRWGFPKWDGKGVVINAKAETVLEKTLFLRSILERRCVLPSTGFFEWQRVGGKIQVDSGQMDLFQGDELPLGKYLLGLGDGPMLYMAGMYNTSWDDGGGSYKAFVILTTAASESVARIHDRMPVILQSDELVRWVTDTAFMQQVLERPGVELVLRRAE